MLPETLLFYFNLGLLGLMLVSEIVLADRYRRRKSLYTWFEALRIVLLLFALGLVVWINSNGLIPLYNPMRLVLTLILLRSAIRDSFELVATR